MGKRRLNYLILISFGLLSAGLLSACQPETGSLDIVANGEDFVKNGFVSVDGWAISLDHLYVSIDEVTVYRSETPFDASTGDLPTGEGATMGGGMLVDLKDDTSLVGRMDELPVGHYNAISWTMSESNDRPSVQMIGTAVKGSDTVDFTIDIDSEFAFSCGEFIGDERKGFVNAGETGEIEMTFHLDHVFGDGDAPADDELNLGALGFDPLAQLAENGGFTADVGMLQQELSTDDFARLIDTLQTLGHVGEGHCYEQSGGYSGH